MIYLYICFGIYLLLILFMLAAGLIKDKNLWKFLINPMWHFAWFFFSLIWPITLIVIILAVFFPKIGNKIFK